MLGAGNAQIDAIRYLRVRGDEIFGCSYSNSDRGIPMLDHFAQIDIKDIQAVTQYAKRIHAEAVYSIGSDLAMPTVCQVSEELHLPHFVSSKTAAICKNKAALRGFLGLDFAGNLPFYEAGSLDEAARYTDCPAVMKPTDAQGQRGVIMVRSQEEIKVHYPSSASYSSSGAVILERYVKGDEYSVNAYLVNGVFSFFEISKREVFRDVPGGIIKSHLLPVCLPAEVSCKIRDLTERVCKKLMIQNGPVYFQIKLEEKSGNPYLIEVTPRLDGCHLWRLIRMACGVDLLQAVFEHLLLGKAPQFTVKQPKEALRLRFLCSAPDEQFDRGNYETEDALFLEWYYETGQKVHSLNGYMEKCGYVIERVDRERCTYE